MDELDDILKNLGTEGSGTSTQTSPEIPETTESSTQTSPEVPESKDPDVETLAEDQKDVEKNINTEPVYEEDNTKYLMSKETAELYYNFGRRYLNLMQERKKIGQDIKALKQEYAEQGLSVNSAVRVLNVIKSEQRRSNTELSELETIRELFLRSKDITDQIAELNAKD